MKYATFNAYYQGRNHDFHFGGRTVTTIFILGGLEVTIGEGLTMAEAEELRKFYDFQTSKHAITGHFLLNCLNVIKVEIQLVKDNTPKYLQFLWILITFLQLIT